MTSRLTSPSRRNEPHDFHAVTQGKTKYPSHIRKKGDPKLYMIVSIEPSNWTYFRLADCPIMCTQPARVGMKVTSETHCRWPPAPQTAPGVDSAPGVGCSSPARSWVGRWRGKITNRFSLHPSPKLPRSYRKTHRMPETRSRLYTRRATPCGPSE